MYIKEYNNDTESSFSIKCNKKLYSNKSKYQKIEIFSSDYYGNILLIDDCFMLTEKNSDQYHDGCIDLLTKKKYKNILIIGGGDFGITHTISKKVIFDKLTLVEIDREVINVCQKYFPRFFKIKKSIRAKIEINICDGYDWICNYKSPKYDLIIVDCTDPDSPSAKLYSLEFYKNIANLLTKGGLFIQQSGSPLIHKKSLIKPMTKKLKMSQFTSIETTIFPMPIYPSGTWSFTHCKKA